MILIDGVRYHSYRFKDESEFERIVEEHAEDIFGKDSLYFGKKKVTSASGIVSIPDGYAISFGEGPRWYVIEIELSTHDVYDHISPQIAKFISGIENEITQRELAGFLEKEVNRQPVAVKAIQERFGEIYKFLSDLVHQPPTILVVVDESVPQLNEALTHLRARTKVLEFRTYSREGVGIQVHAHAFEPLFSIAKTTTTTTTTFAARPMTTDYSSAGLASNSDVIEDVLSMFESLTPRPEVKRLKHWTRILSPIDSKAAYTLAKEWYWWGYMDPSCSHPEHIRDWGDDGMYFGCVVKKKSVTTRDLENLGCIVDEESEHRNAGLEQIKRLGPDYEGVWFWVGTGERWDMKKLGPFFQRHWTEFLETQV